MKVLEVIAIFQKAAGTSVFCGEVSKRMNAAEGMEAVIAVPDAKAKGMYTADIHTRLISIRDAMESGEKWDVVHIHGIWSPILHRVAGWAWRRNIPIVWSPHGMLRHRALKMKRLKKLVALALYQWWDLRKATLLHVCSDMERRDIERLRLGVRFVTAPLGVEIHESYSATVNKHKTILYVGRINRGKGLMNLVGAWALSRREGWRVVIAGFNEEGCEEELKARIGRLGIASDFSFLGPMYGQEKERLMADADIFVLPSLSENFGSVVIESLAQCTPVIATRETPWDDLAATGCGWWIDVGIKPLARALSEAMALPDAERREMGIKGRRLVEAKYTWDVAVDKIRAGYELVCNSSDIGSVVAKDVPPWIVVAGNPAKKLCKRVTD